MTPETVAILAGAFLAILFEYVPKLHPWYNNLEDAKQQLIMLGCILVVVAGAFSLSCVGWMSAWPCTTLGLRDAIFTFVLTIAANQGVHRILPKKEKPKPALENWTSGHWSRKVNSEGET